MIRRLNDALMQYIQSSAKAGIFSTDQDLTIRFWNDWLAERTGKPADEVLGKNLLELFPDLSERHIDRYYYEALQGNPVVLSQRFHHYLLPMVRAVDSETTTLMRQSAEIVPLRDGPDIIGTITMIEDVTDRYLREEELVRYNEQLRGTQKTLIEREAYFRSLIENAPDLIVVIDDSGVIQYASPSARRIGGVDPSDVIGRSALDWIHPEDAEQFKDAMEKALDEQIIVGPLVGRVRSMDGSWLHMEGFLTPLVDEKAKKRLVVNSRDITDRFLAEEKLRESEEKYRQLFSKERDAIMLLDMENGRFLDVNEAAEALFGYSREELLEMTIVDVSQEAEETRQSIARCAKEGSIWIPIRRYRRKDGSSLPVEVSAGSFRWQDRHVMCAILRDITERLQMEQELLSTKKLEAIGLLAGGIAHDFNNLLSIILGNIKLAQMDMEGGERAYRFLLDAEQGALKAAELTRRFVTFAGGGAPAMQVMAVGPLIGQMAELVFSGSEIHCVLDIPGNLFAAEIDPQQFGEALYNVLVNAREASSPGSTVTITAGNEMHTFEEGREGFSESEARPFIKISICDEGTGISEENLPRIFDPYFSTKTRGTQKGMGLGLSVAYSTIDRHKGTIRVTSQPGVGTRVEIQIPAIEIVLPETRPTTVARAKKPARVLLMDDEEMFRQMAAEMLRRLGCETVDLAADGEEALEKFKLSRAHGVPYDLLILDLKVRKGKSATAIIGTIRSLDKEVKVVVTSGYGNNPVLTDYVSYGFDAALAKPFRMAELQEILNAVAAVRERE